MSKKKIKIKKTHVNKYEKNIGQVKASSQENKRQDVKNSAVADSASERELKIIKNRTNREKKRLRADILNCCSINCTGYKERQYEPDKCSNLGWDGKGCNILATLVDKQLEMLVL